MTIWERIEDVVDNADGHLRLEMAAECSWSGELRIGLTNPKGAPARSMTFFSAGGGNPAEVVERLLADYEDWQKSAGRG